jgi:hypothetical protein
MSRLGGVGSEGVETREAIGASSHSVSKKAAFMAAFFHGHMRGRTQQLRLNNPVGSSDCRISLAVDHLNTTAPVLYTVAAALLVRISLMRIPRQHAPGGFLRVPLGALIARNCWRQMIDA